MKKFFEELMEKFLTGVCNFFEFAKENLCNGTLLAVTIIVAWVVFSGATSIYLQKSDEYDLMMAVSGKRVDDENLTKTANMFKEAIDGDTPEKRLSALAQLKDGNYFNFFLKEKEEMLSLMKHEKTIADVMQKPSGDLVSIIVSVCLISVIGVFPIGSFIKLQNEGYFGYTTVKKVFLGFPWKKWWFWLIAIYWLLGYWLLFFIWFLIRIKTDKEIIQENKE